MASLQDALDDAGELAAIGVEDGEMEKPRVSLRWRCAALAVAGVEAYVVMVASCRQESVVRTVDGHLEAKHVAVEVSRPIEVSDTQMHVPDAHLRVKL